MPLSTYLRIIIDGNEAEILDAETIPLAISYALEDRENFQSKTSSKALSITLPATTINDRISNTFHNPSVEDNTVDQAYKKPRKGIIKVNGSELLVGKAFLNEAAHEDNPTEYEYDFYGNNGDWIIDLKEYTLHDALKHIKIPFNKETIEQSWLFDGMDKARPYVFAPARYGQPFDELKDITGATLKQDYNMRPEYMKPSISKYWIIYEAFRSLGYRIQSNFFDSEYFRRQVMPWTWGSFLRSEGTKLDELDFLAKSATQQAKTKSDFKGYFPQNVTNTTTNGGFDNSGVYEYDPIDGGMTWLYKPDMDHGVLMGTFHLNVFLDAKATTNSSVTVRAQWFKNGVRVQHGDDDGNGTLLMHIKAGGGVLNNVKEFIGNVDDWATFNVVPGDVIMAKIWVDMNDTTFGRNSLFMSVDAFELDYFRVPLGGDIDFENYLAFKNYKFLDFFAGVIDEFNLSFGTDPVSKIVYIEPQHPYSLNDNMGETAGGYFNGNMLDWTQKQDFSKKNRMILFKDGERELQFKYKDDTNDGTYNIVANRNSNKPALAKYVLPERFKAGKATIENRFFSAVMHTDCVQWKNLESQTSVPQMVALIPENISNTSRDEAENTFLPKSAYYKGIEVGVKWYFDGEVRDGFPFMFAVNYKAGGETDPILSYCDEQIGPDQGPQVTGKGLLRRFYRQRLEIMRNGQYYMAWFRLNNTDVENFLHREYIICRGQKWEVVEISNYRPLVEESTLVYLRKWVPITNG